MAFWVVPALFLGFFFVPAALWSCTLTPVVVRRNVFPTLNMSAFMSKLPATSRRCGIQVTMKLHKRTHGHGESAVRITGDAQFIFDLYMSVITGTLRDLASASRNV